MQIHSIDDLGYDKERSLFGKTTALKFQRLKIMIIGLESLGVEIAKNIIQNQPEVITLCDQNPITFNDLEYNSSVKEPLQQINRSQACEFMLKDQFSSATQIKICDFNINNYFDKLKKQDGQLSQQLIDEIDKHDLIIIADILSFKKVKIELRELDEQKVQLGSYMVWNFRALQQYLVLIIKNQGYFFEDYGSQFKIFDKDGQQAFPFYIENITKADPGVVRIIKDKPHNYETGDFVCIHEVEGTVEVNGNEPRPIKVLSPYEFTIEDTSQYQKYVKGGLVQLAKVPFKVKYPSLEEQIIIPQLDKISHYQNEEQITKALICHSTLISIISILESSQECSEEELVVQSKSRFVQILQKLQDMRLQKIDSLLQKDNKVTLSFNLGNKVPENIDLNSLSFSEDLSLCLIKQFRWKLFPMVAFWGGFVSLEIIKFTGSTIFGLLIHQGPIMEEFYSSFKLTSQQIVSNDNNQQQNQRHLSQRMIFGEEAYGQIMKASVLLAGLGGNGCEFLRVLTMMGISTDPNSKLTIVDDARLHKFNLKTHFWFNQEDLGQLKTKIAQRRAWEINQNVNIEILETKLCSSQEDKGNKKNLDWSQVNFVISAIHSSNHRRYIANQCEKLGKSLLDLSLNNLKFFTQIYVKEFTKPPSIEEDTVHVFDFSQETWQLFPFLPIHSLLWAKKQFEIQYVGTYFHYKIMNLETYLQDPKSYIDNAVVTIVKNETPLTRILVFWRLLSEENILNVQNFITFGKEIFDVQNNIIQKIKYYFSIKIRKFLEKYPPDLKVNDEYFWTGYKKAPSQILFDFTNETHITFVQITALLFARLFQVRGEELFDARFVRKILTNCYSDRKNNYWNFDKEIDDPFIQQILVKLREIENPKKINIHYFNFEEDNIRNLYIENIYLLTNLRSKAYSIQPIPKYKIQKYALDINKSNPMMHSMLVGQLCLEIYKFFISKNNPTFLTLHFDMNKNLFQFAQAQ